MVSSYRRLNELRTDPCVCWLEVTGPELILIKRFSGYPKFFPTKLGKTTLITGALPVVQPYSRGETSNTGDFSNQISIRFQTFSRVAPAKTMRFLMLNWRDPGNPLAGGAERVSLGYLAALVERGHEVWWLANGFSGCRKTAEFEGVKVVRCGRIGFSIFEAWRWTKAQPRFDLVIDQHHGIPWFAPWWSGTRTIAYIHEVLGPIWQSFYPFPIAWLGRIQEAIVLRLYKSVPFWSACPSTEAALRRLGVRLVTLIPYGVATEALKALPKKRIVSTVRLIVVSRLAPNKRIDDAIRALAVLRERGCKATLKIVGGGETRYDLGRLAETLDLSDQVCFLGQLSESEKDLELASSHLLLHTSIREGWGLNVIEANCMGTPAVVYPVPGLIESTVHESTGLVASDETPEALADEIQRFVNQDSLYQDCRVGAWRRSKEYHWDAILPRACEWLEGLATERTK